VRELTVRRSHLPKEARIKALGSYLEGWCEYFKRAQQPKLFYKLDGWIYRHVIAMWTGKWRGMVVQEISCPILPPGTRSSKSAQDAPGILQKTQDA